MYPRYLVLCLLCLLFSTQASENNTLIFDDSDSKGIFGFSKELLANAYDKLGYQLKYSRMPPARALVEANKGHLDGIQVRLDVDANIHQDLIQVPHRLFDTYLTLIIDPSLCPDCTAANIDEVAGVVGSRSLKNYLALSKKDIKVSSYKSSSQIIELLQAGKVQAIVLMDFMLDKNVRRAHPEWQISHLQSYPVFHYLHKSHQDLVPLIAHEIRELERQGISAKLRQRYNLTFINDDKLQLNFVSMPPQ